MIDETKSRSNKELLEAASVFNFGEYRIIKDGRGWYIKKYNAVYDRVYECMYDHPTFTHRDDYHFDSVYDALDVVKELIK